MKTSSHHKGPKNTKITSAVAFLVLFVSLWFSPSSLAQKANEIGYDTLVGRLDNRDPVIRREACKLLGELGDRRAVQPLGKLIKDLDEETRFRAVEAMGGMLDRGAIPFFTEAARDPSRRVKLAAIEGMVTLYISTQGPGGVSGVFHRAADLIRQSSNDLVVPPGTQVDPKVIEALGATSGDPDDEAAKSAARGAGILRGNAAVPAMATVLVHAPPGVKLEILRAFQKIRDPRATKDVAMLLSSSDKTIRAQAAYTLGLLGARDQIGPLQKLFESDPQKDVRHSALEAISLMPQPQHGEWFLKLLESDDDRWREFAADGLGRLADSALPAGAVDKLKARRSGEKNARVKLALAFALFAHGQSAALNELIDSLNSTLHRQYGISYLTELGRDPARLTQFYPHLKSEKTDVRRHLCEVLGNIGNPAALEPVRPLIKDNKSDVVTAAIRAVQILERVQK